MFFFLLLSFHFPSVCPYPHFLFVSLPQPAQASYLPPCIKNLIDELELSRYSGLLNWFPISVVAITTRSSSICHHDRSCIALPPVALKENIAFNSN
jgi:hypothetical protein